jgi:amino acid transporter
MSSELFTSGNFLITLAVALAAGAIFAGAAWLERRPRQDLKPGLVPPIPVMLVAGVVALLAIVHLINLLGIQTGR